MWPLVGSDDGGAELQISALATVWPGCGLQVAGRVADSCEPRGWFLEQGKKGRGVELSQSGEKDSHGDAIF